MVALDDNISCFNCLLEVIKSDDNIMLSSIQIINPKITIPQVVLDDVIDFIIWSAVRIRVLVHENTDGIITGLV